MWAGHCVDYDYGYMFDPHRSIVVGFGQDPASLDALALAAALGRATGSGLVGVHVTEGEYRFTPFDSVSQVELRADAAALRDRFDRGVAEIGFGGSASFQSIAATNASLGLSQLVADGRPLALVVGSTHLGGIGRFLLAGTGELTTRGTSCAVTVAARRSRAGRSEITAVGVGFDGSAASTTAVSTASAVAAAAGATLHAIAVAPHGERRPAPASGLADALDAALEEADAADAERSVLSGDPVKELTRVGEDLDLLVVGSPAHAPLRHALAGSVCTGLLHRGATPLMVVPNGGIALPAPA